MFGIIILETNVYGLLEDLRMEEEELKTKIKEIIDRIDRVDILEYLYIFINGKVGRYVEEKI